MSSQHRKPIRGFWKAFTDGFVAVLILAAVIATGANPVRAVAVSAAVVVIVGLGVWRSHR